MSQFRQLGVVGGEEGGTLDVSSDVSGHRPGQTEPVVGGGAPAQLVYQDQGGGGGRGQDRLRLHHLRHEGGHPLHLAVTRTDPHHDGVHHAHLHLVRRHETADLRHQHGASNAT